MYPNCNRPKFANQICNVSPMRSIGWIHAGYILNVPHFSDVIVLCPKCGRSIKLGTLRSHDWVHSKSDQHFSQEQIKTEFMGTFSINPTFAPGHIGVTCCLYSQCIQHVPGGYFGPCPQCHHVPQQTHSAPRRNAQVLVITQLEI